MSGVPASLFQPVLFDSGLSCIILYTHSLHIMQSTVYIHMYIVYVHNTCIHVHVYVHCTCTYNIYTCMYNNYVVSMLMLVLCRIPTSKHFVAHHYMYMYVLRPHATEYATHVYRGIHAHSVVTPHPKQSAVSEDVDHTVDVGLAGKVEPCPDVPTGSDDNVLGELRVQPMVDV